MADNVLDVKGLNCPLPILKTRKALKEVPAGGILEVFTTDPGSVADFQAFCRTTGNELIEHGEDVGVYRFLIRKTQSALSTIQ
jgi:tRNA 2-thiouridine synthesizing protein A